MKTALSLGSNLGDRLRHLQQARNYLLSLSRGEWRLQSPVYETDPVDCPPGSAPYLNAVVEIKFAGEPRDLLVQTLAYEVAHGRDRSHGIVNAPRTIDIDLLYCGDQCVREPDLILPHPRLGQRRFVLQPLADIRPDLILPSTAGRTVCTLLQELPAEAGKVRLVAQDW